MKSLFSQVAKAMLVILLLSVISLFIVVPFAFDAPGTTWQDVVKSLTVFYVFYVWLPWFEIFIVFFYWRQR